MVTMNVGGETNIPWSHFDVGWLIPFVDKRVGGR